MFGLRNIKKIFGDKEVKKNATLKERIGHKVEAVFSFVSSKIDEFFDNFDQTKEKLNDLRKTNYELARRHLEKGNVKEAVFRFKLVKRFWPECYEAYYGLAYSFIVSKKIPQARKIIDELIEKNSSYEERALKLLNSIEQVQVYYDQKNKAKES